MDIFYKKHRNLILLSSIIVFALLCRWIRYWECDLLERDTFALMKMGKAWAAGQMADAYMKINGGDLSVPPLLPAVMALGESCGIGALNAGLWFNLSAGALIPLALYIICRGVFEESRYALWAALIGAVNPFMLRLSALVMRDTPYICMVMFAVACGVWAVKKRNGWYWMMFALCTSAATLLRKEGPELLFIFCCWSVWALWNARAAWKNELLYLLRIGVGIMVIFCIFTIPAQTYLRRHSECVWTVLNEMWLGEMYRKITAADFKGEYEDKKKY